MTYAEKYSYYLKNLAITGKLYQDESYHEIKKDLEGALGKYISKKDQSKMFEFVDRLIPDDPRYDY